MTMRGVRPGVDQLAAVIDDVRRRTAELERHVSDFSHGGTIDGDLTVNEALDLNGPLTLADDMMMVPQGPSAPLGDTFSADTYKSRIDFGPGASSDPGAIVHETGTGGEANEGVLHLMPSDDNNDGDYVSIHGTNDPDTLRLHTSGKIEGVTSLSASGQLSGSSVSVTGNVAAATYGGLSLSAGNSLPVGRQIVTSHTNGYTYLGWINTVSGNFTGTPSRIYASNDAFVRYMSLANFRKHSSHTQHVRIEREYDATANTGSALVTLGSTIGGYSMSGVTAVFGSVTCVSTGNAGYVTIYDVPKGSTPPSGSQANYATSGLANGFFFVDVDTSRRFRLYRSTNVRVIIDIQGLVYGNG